MQWVILTSLFELEPQVNISAFTFIIIFRVKYVVNALLMQNKFGP